MPPSPPEEHGMKRGRRWLLCWWRRGEERGGRGRRRWRWREEEGLNERRLMTLGFVLLGIEALKKQAAIAISKFEVVK